MRERSSAPAPTASLRSTALPASTACAADAAAASRLAATGSTPVGRPTDRAAFDSAVAASGGRAVRLGATTVGFADFLPNDTTVDGGELGAPAGGLIGAGEDSTDDPGGAAQLHPGARHPVDVPGHEPARRAEGGRVRVGAARASRSGAPTRGTSTTACGSARSDDLSASDIRVVGIPGDDSQPPGETFGDQRLQDRRVALVAHRGRRRAASAGPASRSNSSRDITHLRHRLEGQRLRAWASPSGRPSGIRLVDCAAIDNGFSGFNFERVSGTVTLVRPVATGNRYGMRIASDQGSATLHDRRPEAHGRPLDRHAAEALVRHREPAEGERHQSHRRRAASAGSAPNRDLLTSRPNARPVLTMWVPERGDRWRPPTTPGRAGARSLQRSSPRSRCSRSAGAPSSARCSRRRRRHRRGPQPVPAPPARSRGRCPTPPSPPGPSRRARRAPPAGRSGCRRSPSRSRTSPRPTGPSTGR